MLASAGPYEKPMATPLICRYMILSKLNSTDLVAVCMSTSTKLHAEKTEL